jgi:tetratricopeptide (TPR) repeat protein
MVKKHPAVTLLLLLVTSVCSAQSFEDRFLELYEKNDTMGQEKLLRQWETAEPRNPEMFICYFNFYVNKSTVEVLSIDAKKKVNDALILTDTGTGKPAGFLNVNPAYLSAPLKKGFEYIDKGISFHPNRLDMRFGKIFMLGKTGNFREFTSEIIKTIERNNQIKQAWLWKKGVPLEDAKNFFLGNLQGYIGTLYNEEDDDLLPYMRQISEKVLSYYPDHIESLSNVALTWLIVGDYDKALTQLLKAEVLDSNDIIVLNNIAEAYKRKGEKNKARSYYEKIIKYGTKEDIQYAKDKLKELD